MKGSFYFNSRNIIGGKWKTITLCHLTHGPKKSGELMKLMPVITHKMLTQSLCELVADGLITRTSFEGKQLKVVYELTDLGYTLQPVLRVTIMDRELTFRYEMDM
jgi:DNA-binding HxlR family transcriptional regulator